MSNNSGDSHGFETSGNLTSYPSPIQREASPRLPFQKAVPMSKGFSHCKEKHVTQNICPHSLILSTI